MRYYPGLGVGHTQTCDSSPRYIVPGESPTDAYRDNEDDLYLSHPAGATGLPSRAGSEEPDHGDDDDNDDQDDDDADDNEIGPDGDESEGDEDQDPEYIAEESSYV